jgi:hypothetical protein
VEDQAVAISNTYTNSLQLKEMMGVLEQRENLKFAELDCWEAVAETMPTGLQLETFNFNDGKSLSLRGTVPTDQVTTLTDFFDNLRKWKKGSQPLFGPNADEVPRRQINQGGASISWSFELELKQSGNK